MYIHMYHYIISEYMTVCVSYMCYYYYIHVPSFCSERGGESERWNGRKEDYGIREDREREGEGEGEEGERKGEGEGDPFIAYPTTPTNIS